MYALLAIIKQQNVLHMLLLCNVRPFSRNCEQQLKDRVGMEVKIYIRNPKTNNKRLLKVKDTKNQSCRSKWSPVYELVWAEVSMWLLESRTQSSDWLVKRQNSASIYYFIPALDGRFQ